MKALKRIWAWYSGLLSFAWFDRLIARTKLALVLENLNQSATKYIALIFGPLLCLLAWVTLDFSQPHIGENGVILSDTWRYFDGYSSALLGIYLTGWGAYDLIFNDRQAKKKNRKRSQGHGKRHKA